MAIVGNAEAMSSKVHLSLLAKQARLVDNIGAQTILTLEDDMYATSSPHGTHSHAERLLALLAETLVVLLLGNAAAVAQNRDVWTAIESDVRSAGWWGSTEWHKFVRRNSNGESVGTRCSASFKVSVSGKNIQVKVTPSPSPGKLTDAIRRIENSFEMAVLAFDGQKRFLGTIAARAFSGADKVDAESITMNLVIGDHPEANLRDLKQVKWIVVGTAPTGFTGLPYNFVSDLISVGGGSANSISPGVTSKSVTSIEQASRSATSPNPSGVPSSRRQEVSPASKGPEKIDRTVSRVYAIKDSDREKEIIKKLAKESFDKEHSGKVRYKVDGEFKTAEIEKVILQNSPVFLDSREEKDGLVVRAREEVSYYFTSRFNVLNKSTTSQAHYVDKFFFEKKVFNDGRESSWELKTAEINRP